MTRWDGRTLTLEPQRITDFTVTNGDTRWVEDRPAEPPAVLWHRATVMAEGEAFNLAQAGLESLITLLGLVPGPLGVAASASGVVAPGAVNRVVNELTEGACSRVEAPRYGPIRVEDEQWTRVDIIGQSIELAGSSHRQFRGVDIGFSTAEISLKKEPFGLLADIVEEIVVEVEPLRISAMPSRARVSEPGEVIALRATVPNAYGDPGSFSATRPPDATGSIITQQKNDNIYEVTFQTPPNVDDFPTAVLFTANHSTLPTGSPAREYLVNIDLGGELRISPRNGCLQPNGTLTLEAELSGLGEEDGILWTTSQGSIQPIGEGEARFTAPGQTGTVEITATAAADSSITDTVSLSVSHDCLRKAWWPGALLALDGNGTYSSGGACPPDDHADEQLVELLGADQPGSISEILNSSNIWYDRTERISAQLLHTSTRHHPTGGQCPGILLGGRHDGEAEYSASNDGTLSVTFKSELTGSVHDLCASHADGRRECVGGRAVLGMLPGLPVTGVYLIEVGGSAKEFLLEGAFSCEAMAGNATALPMEVTVLGRFRENGDPWIPSDPSSSPFGISTPGGESIWHPRLMSLDCEQATDARFVVDASPSGETLQMIIQVSGGMYAPASLSEDPGHHIDAMLWVRLTSQ